jgi:hypothetical protein
MVVIAGPPAAAMPPGVSPRNAGVRPPIVRDCKKLRKFSGVTSSTRRDLMVW